VNGTDLHYEVDGEGRPCLVLHGGLGVDHTLYRRTLGPLSPPLQLIYLDHRCNGRSGRPPIETLTMEQLADDAVGLADHLGIDRFLVLGHSYGGFIAQELALRHVDRVEGLLLLDTTPGQLGTGESSDETEQGPPMPAEVVEILSTLPATDAEFENSWPQILPWYLHRRDATEVHALLDGTVFHVAAMARGFEVLASWSSVDRLSSITCPTLLVAGRHDLFTSFPQAHRIARRLPDADVVVFEHSGHFPWLDEPNEFFPAVRDWLSARFG
jgi:proline iminopeptidase